MRVRERQRRTGVPMERRRPLLLEALNRLYAEGRLPHRPGEPVSRAGAGFVSLVGAGPGDPELLTRKGARRLAEADLVLYDALVDAGDPGPRAKGPTLSRGEARGPPLDTAGDDQRPARPRGPAGAAGRALEVRGPLRPRPRRRGGVGARRGGRPLRGRARCHHGGGGARARGDPRDPPRVRVGLRRGLAGTPRRRTARRSTRWRHAR